MTIGTPMAVRFDISGGNQMPKEHGGFVQDFISFDVSAPGATSGVVLHQFRYSA